jgi:NADH:ubiquinone oxidoreductase subunit C
MNKLFFRYTLKLIPTIKIFKNEVCLYLPIKKILPLLIFFKNHTHTQYKILSDLCVIDYPLRTNRFEIVYNFLSLRFNSRLTVKVLVNDTTIIPTITDIFINADWWEREAWDMFGIYFLNNKNMRRLLNDYGFEGHPLRKDFPLSGYTEIRYSETSKRVIYEPIVVSQDYRTYCFQNTWK